MESVLELKGKLQNVYAQYSTYIDKVVRFVLAFVAFFMINREIGYIEPERHRIHGDSERRSGGSYLWCQRSQWRCHHHNQTGSSLYQT